MKSINIISILLIIGLWSCQGPEKSEEFSFSSENLMSDIQTLSSDEFEGRAPSSVGEEKTIEFMTKRFQEAGAIPGNGDSFLQEVPLVAITADKEMALTISNSDEMIELKFKEDYVGWTKQLVDSVSLDASEMVFVGYGINAPEFGWNDYEGVDVNGKTVLILVNDPGYATQVDSVFTGNAMTYYGRWTYKYEEAARQGAAAALIVHQTGPAGYPWEVVTGSWTGTQFGLVSSDNNMSRCKVEGWVTLDAAKQLFELANVDMNQVFLDAAQKTFTSVNLSINMSARIKNKINRSVSNNILAKVEGKSRPDEYLIFTAHWDHLGKDNTLEGDQIYNGAVDNATGTAALLELARAFAENPPDRSVLFLAVTAEEQGLLGSAYYAQNPVYPREKTVAVINIDAMNVDGPMSDIIVIGYGNSELDLYVDSVAMEQGRTVIPDAEPEKGFFFRSDHFSFAKEGIPALYAESGVTHVEHGEEWVMARREEYTSLRYHKPADEITDQWDLSGTVVDLEMYYKIADRLANTNAWPKWNEGVAFKAKRDEMMQK